MITHIKHLLRMSIANTFSPMPRNTARSLQASDHCTTSLTTSSQFPLRWQRCWQNSTVVSSVQPRKHWEPLTHLHRKPTWRHCWTSTWYRIQLGRYLESHQRNITCCCCRPRQVPAILKRCCNSTVKINVIWRKSLDLDQIPLILKTSDISQGRSQRRSQELRIHSAHFTHHQVLWKVIQKKIVEHMETNGIFNPSQHEFRFGRPCISQRIAHDNYIIELLENGGNVDVICIYNFAKASDKVDFGITLTKLSSLAVTGKVGRWIYKTQVVLVNSGRSQPSELKPGVPQGSVLGWVHCCS